VDVKHFFLQAAIWRQRSEALLSALDLFSLQNVCISSGFFGPWRSPSRTRTDFAYFVFDIFPGEGGKRGKVRGTLDGTVKKVGTLGFLFLWCSRRFSRTTANHS